MKIKNTKFTLNFSVLLSMNMEFFMQIDDKFKYKLSKKKNYCFRSVITKYYFALRL
jgi:hypothetical protein